MSIEETRDRLRKWRELRSAKPTGATDPDAVERRISFVMARVNANTELIEGMEEGYTGILTESRAPSNPRYPRPRKRKDPS